jgi:membrane associated rhomboid family serine protease
MTPTPVGMRCPECARQRTRVTTAQSFIRGAAPVVTYALVAINVAVEVAQLATGGTLGGAGGTLVEHGALSRATVNNGEVWRLVTSGFLHAGLLHLLFNMLSLYIVGGILEPAVGRVRFAVIYFVSLLAGSFGALVAQPHGLTLGASGAVFGVMGAAAVVLRSRGIDVMQSGLGIWIILNLVLSFRPGISIGGHIGGLIGGAVLAYLMVEAPRRVRMPAFAPWLLSAVLCGAAVAGSIAISGSVS